MCRENWLLFAFYAYCQLPLWIVSNLNVRVILWIYYGSLFLESAYLLTIIFDCVMITSVSRLLIMLHHYESAYYRLSYEFVISRINSWDLQKYLWMLITKLAYYDSEMCDIRILHCTSLLHILFFSWQNSLWLSDSMTNKDTGTRGWKV